MARQAKTRSGRQQRSVASLEMFSGLTASNVPWRILNADVLDGLKALDSQSFDCAITSPPYFWQRDYKVKGQIGQEPTIDAYVTAIADTMDEVKRVLKTKGLLFMNLGDTYYSAKGQPKGVDRKNSARRFGLRAVDASGLGVPRKTLIGIPWRVALEMLSRGWVLRSPIIWQRNGSIPEPTAKDRPWRSYEFIFLFARSPTYYFRRENLEGEEDIWTIPARPKRSGHNAAFPDKLVAKCLEVGCPKNGEVLDPFAGSGTVLRAALETGRPATGIDLSVDFCRQMEKELKDL
jgi:DNA modification methylase